MKVCFGSLDQGRRIIYLITSERRSFWRTKRELKPIGHWECGTEEFVSTEPLLDQDLFWGIVEVIQWFVAQGALPGEFNFCPVCSQKCVGPKIKREIGFMIRFF